MHFNILIWITNILEQQYVMTVITVIKFEAGQIKTWIPTRLCFRTSNVSSIDNVLPKMTNKTLAPIISADNISILFAHSNLIDLNKNIHIVFGTLNKWFRANQLSLSLIKTNYLHFTAKRNMSVNLQIGFNNNLITNSSYTKFLEVTMDVTLSWKHRINLLIKKLIMACCIIRNAKTYLSALSLKMIYHAFFHSAMSKGIIF